AWSKFDQIQEALWPTTKGLRHLETRLHEAKEAFEDGEKGAATQPEAAKEGLENSLPLVYRVRGGKRKVIILFHAIDNSHLIIEIIKGFLTKKHDGIKTNRT
ncbi:hypothetical protein ZWY2020_003166, partial [Hordeum vulgare]